MLKPISIIMTYYIFNSKSKVAIEILLDATQHSLPECDQILYRICLMLGSDWQHSSSIMKIRYYTIIPAS